MAEQPMFRRVAIIGLGLIGGSFAAALRRQGLAGTVVAGARSARTLEQGLALGLIDEGSQDLALAVRGADLVFVSTPVSAMETVLTKLAPGLSDRALVTDGGSVKTAVIDQARRALGAHFARFVPGHPIAGKEKSGVEAADAELYRRHRVILTPTADTDPEAARRVRALWTAIGAEVLSMAPEHHDQVLAETSHLPHLLAFSLVDTLARQGDSTEIFRYAAGGFRDFTRIAGSDPVMWHDIFRENRGAVLDALGLFRDGIDRFQRAIEDNDSEALMGIMTRANSARAHFLAMNARTSYTRARHSDDETGMTQHSDPTFVVAPGGRLQGRLRVPGDKSMSHRSIMLASLAEGSTEIGGFLEGEDALATLQAFRDMGVVIEGPHNGRVLVHGVGPHGLKAPGKPLYMGNSGTSMRLLTGLLAGQAFDTELTGDASLSKRPMERVARPLREMGAVIETGEGGRPPVRIRGGAALKGIHYDLPMASAQVKSAVLLAGLYAEGDTSVTEPAPTRDHTERMLNGFGYPVRRDGATATLSGGGALRGGQLDVPADISSAAFFLVGASIAEGGEVTLPHVGVNPTRTGVIDILKRMGADIRLENQRDAGGEPVADLVVKSAPLKGIVIPEELVPLAIDELPAVFIAAACAEGETVLRGAEELRVKESDRIQVMADGLATLGVEHEVYEDGIRIVGGPYGGGQVESHGDHRIAMSFAMAALRASAPITIHHCANVATSFPGFAELARAAGLALEVQAPREDR
ncbi:MAG: bifunctional prephenate dehydrogenase/3-phosphoshikimate 1-carboxyvinyltransferase [Alcanivorax sp.]|nr:bifunctional prephenate dehydrogenase/3-phosphoshikimate 1-carboxyvinyltransferase [Alcanivorax sp.]MAY11333.1 bifunctional prephenate dehydrogenase/3-phosphoshikimate 1-carboxyvinyltransferase [Alcanivorax sp.]MBI53304.1 bifunctional prephenate dehydrogenase/3-phosphoshikimate 1-carboxyvinyltransferase [Alcanivorax sp.]MBU58435.1 bifunctional prephenate dehydrogenase/3-phosphoshikimate 1-carboxyvinyltransferase [Alcanivorax sp.]HCE39231.1 bifunctional prephenate dehydrogenase/3-phosphoshiki|tara:strand:+ start:30452 stop:32710 length:2259 start_codon:yes stop_codon:yes gene_type:complete